jgi:hypothetical protein
MLDPMPPNPPVVRLCRTAESTVTLDAFLNCTQILEIDGRLTGRLVLALLLFFCLPQLIPNSDIEFIVYELAVMVV